MTHSDISAAKQAIREAIWDDLHELGIAPDCRDRIPDFMGREAAAQNLAHLALWRDAEVIMVTPDEVLAPVRLLALKRLLPMYMAVPGLKEEKPFVLYTPTAQDAAKLREQDVATNTILELPFGRPVTLDELERPQLPRVDLVVGGSVAVDNRGVRTGKGKGFFDIELAMLLEANAIQPNTPVTTIVHSRQVIEGELPEDTHDGRLTAYATERGSFEIDVAHHRPLPGLLLSQLGEYAHTVPALRRMLNS